jgi:hypothetical protein
MSVRQPAQVRASTDSSREVVFRVEVSADGPHPPADLAYVDAARREVRHGRETDVSVTSVSH